MTAPIQELARVSAERMLNGMAGGVAIAVLAGGVLYLIGRRNSSTRFAVLLTALFSIAALPFLNPIANAGPVHGTPAPWTVTLPAAWATYLIAAWSALALFGLARVGLGLWQLRRIRMESTPVDLDRLDLALQQTISTFSSRPVEIAASDTLTVPTAIGFFRPMIVLPNWTLQELSAAELNSILIHEFAHLERRDDWTNLAQKVLRALFFFHPAVWWVERQLSLEREMACDAAVLARSANPRVYAECLVNIAERNFLRRGLALAQAAVSRMRQTTLRVTQILRGERPAVQRSKPITALAVVLSGIFVAGLTQAPELVAFRNAGPTATVASMTVQPQLLESRLPSAAPKAVLASLHAQKPRKAATLAVKQVEAKLTPALVELRPAATLASTKSTDVPPQTIFVVMRTQQVSPDGASWTIRVWQFTILKPEQVPAGLKNPAKST